MLKLLFSLKNEERNLLAPIAMDIIRRKAKMNPPLGIDEGAQVNSIAQFNEAKSNPSSTKKTKPLEKDFLYTTRNAYDFTCANERKRQGFNYKYSKVFTLDHKSLVFLVMHLIGLKFLISLRTNNLLLYLMKH